MDITKVTGIKKKITKKFVQMTDELILQDRRSNDYFNIKNQPFPFEEELDYLLRRVDIISLHMPLTPETEHFFDHKKS